MKQWAQAALDAEAAGDDVDFDLVLVFQGRDIDENGDLIGFNPFNPDSVKAIIDNVRINGFEFAQEDADFDNDVDGIDFLTWQRGFSATGANNSTGDADGDGDAADLSIWERDYGTGGLQAVAIVPEPSVAALLTLASITLIACRKKPQ